MKNFKSREEVIKFLDHLVEVELMVKSENSYYQSGDYLLTKNILRRPAFVPSVFSGKHGIMRCTTDIDLDWHVNRVEIILLENIFSGKFKISIYIN